MVTFETFGPIDTPGPANDSAMDAAEPEIRLLSVEPVAAEAAEAAAAAAAAASLSCRCCLAA